LINLRRRAGAILTAFLGLVLSWRRNLVSRGAFYLVIFLTIY